MASTASDTEREVTTVTAKDGGSTGVENDQNQQEEVVESGEKVVEKEVVFTAPDCPVEKVTVYPDRAEVCRRVETELSEGLNQVVVKKLPDAVDPDSIRSVEITLTIILIMHSCFIYFIHMG